MNRRHVLLGGTLAVSGLAGCLDEMTTDAGPTDEPASDADEEATATDAEPDGDGTDDVGVPDEVRETGTAALEATLTGTDEDVLSYAPNEHFEEMSRDDWLPATRRDGERWTPDAVHELTLVDGRAAEEIVANLESDPEFAPTVGDAYALEFEVDLEVSGYRYERPVQLLALEIDGEWYAWTETVRSLHPQPQASVEISRDGLETAEITLTSSEDPATVFVRGGEIEDPTTYRLEEVGDTLTIDASDVGSGQFEIVAAFGEPNEYATGLETVALTDPAAWSEVTEITLEARTAGWVGREPDLIVDVTNPTLVLKAEREYTIAQEGGDGAAHNLELRDADDAVVDDHATELSSDTEKRQELTVTATDELDSYVCDPHEPTMRGDIVVVESFDD